eukprot:1520222-Rhodomonas_salina.1
MAAWQCSLLKAAGSTHRPVNLLLLLLLLSSRTIVSRSPPPDAGRCEGRRERERERERERMDSARLAVVYTQG